MFLKINKYKSTVYIPVFSLEKWTDLSSTKNEIKYSRVD